MGKINGSDAKNNELLREALEYRRRMQNVPPEYNVAAVQLSNATEIVVKGSIGQLTPSSHSERIALAHAIKQAIDQGHIQKPSDEQAFKNDAGMTLLTWVENDLKGIKMDHGLTRNMFEPYKKVLKLTEITIFTEREPCKRPTENCVSFLSFLGISIEKIDYLVEYRGDPPVDPTERAKFLQAEKQEMIRKLDSEIRAGHLVLGTARHFFDRAKFKGLSSIDRSVEPTPKIVSGTKRGISADPITIDSSSSDESTKQSKAKRSESKKTGTAITDFLHSAKATSSTSPAPSNVLDSSEANRTFGLNPNPAATSDIERRELFDNTRQSGKTKRLFFADSEGSTPPANATSSVANVLKPSAVPGGSIAASRSDIAASFQSAVTQLALSANTNTGSSHPPNILTDFNASRMQRPPSPVIISSDESDKHGADDHPDVAHHDNLRDSSKP